MTARVLLWRDRLGGCGASTARSVVGVIAVGLLTPKDSTPGSSAMPSAVEAGDAAVDPTPVVLPGDQRRQALRPRYWYIEARRVLGHGPRRSPRATSHGDGIRLAAKHGIICGVRAGGLRISLHAFNSGGDVEHLIAALRELA